VGLGDLLDNCEAEAGAVAIRREPGVKDRLSFLLGDTRAVVFDIKPFSA